MIQIHQQKRQMTPIQNSLSNILAELEGTGASLVAVSKYHPIESVMEAYECGQRVFGESHVQELCMKHDAMPADIEWHFIGHLQSNKVKYIAPFVSLIHAVDTYKLLCEIDRQAAKSGRVIPCLLQVHIAQEETKFGFTPDELKDMLGHEDWQSLSHIAVSGLMCMASNTDDMEQVRREFRSVRELFQEVKAQHFADDDTFRHLSMGMTGDYHIAVSEGSTMVRIGSKIFGERIY